MNPPIIKEQVGSNVFDKYSKDYINRIEKENKRLKQKIKGYSMNKKLVFSVKPRGDYGYEISQIGVLSPIKHYICDEEMREVFGSKKHVVEIIIKELQGDV